MPCDECRLYMKEQGLETECESCYPGIHKWNRAAIVIYNDVSTQYKFGQSGAIVMDIKSVNISFDWHRVRKKERSELWHKVRTVAQSFLTSSTEEAERIAKLKTG